TDRLARRWRALVGVAAVVLGAALVAQSGPGPAAASTLPAGFRDSVVLSGLTNPTVLQFAADGRIFVGQKNGVIKVFQSLTDTNPVTVADLSGEVDDYWDRGLLGLAVDPNFPANPYIYVLYAYDAPIGGTAPTWNDACPTPPDPTTGGGVPGNPFYSSSDANARRIVAYGVRNPFRITQRPGTDELWIGDVGWNTWEEINRVVQPASATASNFGWPCYEGASPQSGYQGAGLDL